MDENRQKELLVLSEKVTRDLLKVMDNYMHYRPDFLFSTAIAFVFGFAKIIEVSEEKLKICLESGLLNYKDLE